MRVSHMIKCWAKGQHVIALSSGEAELYACVRASSEAVGLKSVMKDMGIDAGVEVHVDANAAIGMIMKEGLSGVRHIDTQFLWIQESVRAGRISVKKIDGLLNPADMFTKALGAQALEGHLRRLGCDWIQECPKVWAWRGAEGCTETGQSECLSGCFSLVSIRGRIAWTVAPEGHLEREQIRTDLAQARLRAFCKSQQTIHIQFA